MVLKSAARVGAGGRLGVPTCLESTTRTRRALYGGQGFKARKEVRAPNGGPAVVLMLREPRSGGAVPAGGPRAMQKNGHLT